MRQETFEFESHRESLAGVINLPDGRPRAAVVTTGPLTSVKEQAAGAYARALAERGFAALAFDHRYYGESGGRPRQFENPAAKVEDIRAAAAALADDPRTRGLPLVAVGVCAGGGYMARAVAEEPAVSAFAGVAGVYSDAAQTRAWFGEAYESMVSRAVAAEERFEETGEAETIPAVAAEGGDVAMPLREAYEFYGTRRGAVANYTNGFAVQSHAYTLPFDAQGAAEQIRVPTLVVHSENALSPDLAHEFFASLVVPKSELWLESQGQIDFYDDPALIGPASDAIARFFTEALGPPGTDVA
ncbi:MAG TPA: alpha/beta hydrolase [Acidimicrobiia bacterium]|nr:alpha/beta hydrolase [Acidimicrobiia bacterium]